MFCTGGKSTASPSRRGGTLLHAHRMPVVTPDSGVITSVALDSEESKVGLSLAWPTAFVHYEVHQHGPFPPKENNLNCFRQSSPQTVVSSSLH